MPPPASLARAALPSLLTACAMVAFAANSVLCRLALGERAIDAYAFTAVRLGSGALTLLMVSARGRRRRGQGVTGSWRGALLLMLYALPFSLAYVRVDTGTGALLLFGAVQLTMIIPGLRAGERPGPLRWVGLVGASAGVVYLVSPGVSAPDPAGAALMFIAGAGWGGYSIVGKAAGDPEPVTAGNFLRAAAVVVPATALGWPWLSLSTTGVLLAAASGSLASGLGYVVWYAALRHISLSRAALVQLSVPALAAAGGVLFVGEPIRLRLLLASCLILGSIALGTVSRPRASDRS